MSDQPDFRSTWQEMFRRSENSIVKAFLCIIIVMIFSGCEDKVVIEISHPQKPVHKKDEKPSTPVALGTIRGYFGNYYKTFDNQIGFMPAVDTFSNVYFCGGCDNDLNQINLIRRDSNNMLAIFINGYLLDSLPDTLPVPRESGKWIEIQYSPRTGFDYGSPGSYLGIDNYGSGVLITDRTNDILTGTFQGILNSADGRIMPVTEGEFRIKIYRKYFPCYRDTLK